jgi:hypothetical protein
MEWWDVMWMAGPPLALAACTAFRDLLDSPVVALREPRVELANLARAERRASAG